MVEAGIRCLKGCVAGMETPTVAITLEDEVEISQSRWNVNTGNGRNEHIKRLGYRKGTFCLLE
jgi:hypothetical protein